MPWGHGRNRAPMFLGHSGRPAPPLPGGPGRVRLRGSRRPIGPTQDRSPPTMPTPAADPRAARGPEAVQHADDRQRDRGLQPPGAPPRLPAAPDPLPVPRPRADRRLCGDLGDPGRAADRDGARPERRLPPLRRRPARPEDRRRPGPRQPAGPGRPVRRGQRHDPQEARLRRPHHRRLPARPRRGPRPGLPALRAQPLRQPRLRPAGRLRQAGQARRGRDRCPAS